MDANQILGTAILLGLGLLGWALRTIYNKLTSQDETLNALTVKSNRLEVGLFGYDGQNGINGTVKELKSTVEALVRGHAA